MSIPSQLFVQACKHENHTPLDLIFFFRAVDRCEYNFILRFCEIHLWQRLKQSPEHYGSLQALIKALSKHNISPSPSTSTSTSTHTCTNLNTNTNTNVGAHSGTCGCQRRFERAKQTSAYGDMNKIFNGRNDNTYVWPALQIRPVSFLNPYLRVHSVDEGVRT